MSNIADDICHAYEDGFNAGYEKGKADAEFYLLHCGDETPVTNADMIRSMSDDELAILLANTDGDFPPNIPKNGIPLNQCVQYWLDWLEQECADG